MVRPCFLVVDPEHSGSISTRKLVIESAKLNVITAYGALEALETAKKYPAVDGVVCNTEVHDMPVGNLVHTLKELKRQRPIVVVGPDLGDIGEADYHVESFDPRRLLDVLQSIMPDKVNAIEEHEDEMREDETVGG
jgi:DNA-binding NtrC family response regulator